MPIKNRLDMLATGIKTPVGIKVFGPDLATLEAIGKQRIAAPMVGGMVSATTLTLLVVPALYTIWRGTQLRDRRAAIVEQRAEPVEDTLTAGAAV